MHCWLAHVCALFASWERWAVGVVAARVVHAAETHQPHLPSKKVYLFVHPPYSPECRRHPRLKSTRNLVGLLSTLCFGGFVAEQGAAVQSLPLGHALCWGLWVGHATFAVVSFETMEKSGNATQRNAMKKYVTEMIRLWLACRQSTCCIRPLMLSSPPLRVLFCGLCMTQPRATGVESPTLMICAHVVCQTFANNNVE